ncbi:MAG TPA: LysR substrate-binding domain-containing protein [Microlunatus sp.]|nr:LysR substrate-binding domain-containing protein [Microlunatus sp.]
METAELQRVLRLLPVFVTVAEVEQVTVAASILRLPQPTVSRALGGLGELVGTPVVERRGRGIELTAAGRELLPYARTALDAVAAGVAAVAEDQVVGRGEVPIAFQTVLGESVVPALIRRFRERHPGVRFSLTQGSRQRCLDALERGVSAIALISSPPRGQDLTVVELYSEPMVLVVPRGHRLASLAPVALTEIAREELIVLKAGYGLRDLVDQLFADSGAQPRISFEAEDSHTARGLVSAGLGVTVVPPYPPDAETVQLRIDHPAAQRVVGAVLRRGATSPSVAAFADFLRADGPVLAVSALGPYARLR